MKIDKAIEILTINNEHNPDFTDADRHDANKLGIEALKRIKSGRDTPSGLSFIPLPGETEE